MASFPVLNKWQWENDNNHAPFKGQPDKGACETPRPGPLGSDLYAKIVCIWISKGMKYRMAKCFWQYLASQLLKKYSLNIH